MSEKRATGPQKRGVPESERPLYQQQESLSKLLPQNFRPISKQERAYSDSAAHESSGTELKDL